MIRNKQGLVFIVTISFFIFLLADSCQQKKAVEFPFEKLKFPSPQRFTAVPIIDSLVETPKIIEGLTPTVRPVQSRQYSVGVAAHPNVHPIPRELTQISVNEEALIKSPFIPVADSPTDHIATNDAGDTIATGAWFKLEGTIMNFPPISPTPALKPRFMDRSTNNIQYLDVDQGMASSYVLTITEDKDGALWFGHIEGISKYDGVNFTNYSLKEGFITVWCSLLASDGTLWFGTFGGIIKYDGSQFIHYNNDSGLINGEIKSIAEDSHGNIWFGSLGGLTRYNGSSFMHYTKNEGLMDETVNAILEDEEGLLWLGTASGVIRFDGETFVQYTEESGLSYSTVISIFEDSQGDLWFGTEGGGVNKFDGKSFTHYTSKEGLSGDVVTSIVEDHNSVLWFSTNGGGVNEFTGDSFISYKEREGLYNDILSSHVDKSGRIWLGSLGRGVNVLSPNSFVHFSEEEGLSNSYVYAIEEDHHGNLWFGTDGGGINKYDGKYLTNYTAEDGLIDNSVFSLLADSKGNLWVGSSNNGVSKFDGHSFVNYNEEGGFPEVNCQTITEDAEGNIWFGTEGEGVLKFDGEHFLRYTTDEGLSDNRVNSILSDKKGDLWFGTNVGLTKFDGQSFTHFTAREDFDFSFVNTLMEDHHGNIWVGTRGKGVFQFNGQEFIQYSMRDGLPSGLIWSFVEGPDQHIWVGSEKALTEFVPQSSQNDEDTHFKIINYEQADGLKGIDFLNNSRFLDRQNRLWMGSGKTLTMIDLNKHRTPQKSPKVFVRQLDINGKMIDYRTKKENKTSGIYYDSVQLFESYPINAELTAENNHLTFHYTAIDWQSPVNIQYSFILEGLNDHWSSPTKDTKVDYRNLPPGAYTFRVRARGKSQAWSEEASLSFMMLPPWYQTWWAYVLYVVTIVLAGYSYTYWRTQSLMRQKKVLEETVASRTAVLKKQKEEIELQAFELEKLNDLKSKFYSVVGHDLRSPLTKLFATVFQTKYKLADKDEETKKAFSEFDSIYRNFVELLDNVLDWGLIDSNQKKLVLKPEYLDEIIENVVRLYEPYAFEKQIELGYDSAISEDLQVRIDKGSVEIVIRNLISNALKFTHEGGKIDVRIHQENQTVYLQVRDSGIGISEEKLSTIFEITEKKQTVGTKGEKGTGLGLKLAHDFVQLNKGEISIESVIGEGTSITIKLPVD